MFISFHYIKDIMRWYAIISLLFLGTNAQTDEDMKRVFGTGSEYIPAGFEPVTKPPLLNYSALPTCGEGPDAGKKVCVEYSRCDGVTGLVTPEEVINTSGAGLIDVREGKGSCPHYLQTCCNLPEGNASTTSQSLPPPLIPSSIAPPLSQLPTTPPPTTPLPITPLLITTPSTRPPTSRPNSCGMRNEQGLDFQITGHTNEAEYAEFPWMVALLRTNPQPNETEYFCGGSLIAPSVVLTGAHCVDKYQNNLDQIKIRIGEWDMLSQNERITHQERSIKQIIIHQQFNPKSLVNDIALLITVRALSKADNIGTICLPPTGFIANSRDCFASGWGKTEFSNKVPYSVILKKLKLPIVPREQCQTSLRTTRLSRHFVLDQSLICAGGESVDTCTGDGGSPLVCPDPTNTGRYIQVGIVAWGIGCGSPTVPAAYGNVALFRSWIDQQMDVLGLNKNPYK